MEPIVFKISLQMARRLSYVIGRSDEANAVAQAARQAAMAAEQNVRDVVSSLASQQEQKLPERYSLSLNEESNEVSVVPALETSNGTVEEIPNA